LCPAITKDSAPVGTGTALAAPAKADSAAPELAWWERHALAAAALL
jgi:hypothetical protein